MEEMTEKGTSNFIDNKLDYDRENLARLVNKVIKKILKQEKDTSN